MIDKICCVVYKAINLMMWIVGLMICVLSIAFVIIIPYLGFRYAWRLSLKDSITGTVIFWVFLGLICVIEIAYIKGRDLVQLNEETKK